MTQPPAPPRNRAISLSPVTLAFIGVIAAIELWLTLAGEGARTAALNDYAFVAGYFTQQFRFGFDADASMRLVTYALFHGGWLHAGMNGLAFATFGETVARVAGWRRYTGLFFATSAAGALLFAAIGAPHAFMVGASGGLFGLLGAYKRWEYAILRSRGRDWTRPMLLFAVEMVVINGLLYWGLGGGLAWEAHLGGLIAGWFMGPWAARGRR